MARPVDAVSGSMGEGAPMPVGNGPVSGVFFDRAHHRVFLVWENVIELFDTSTGVVTATLKSPARAGSEIYSIASSVDGTRLVVSGSAGTLLYDAATGASVPVASAPSVIVSTVSPNGVGAGLDTSGRVVLFDPDTLATTADLTAFRGFPIEMAFSDDGRLLVVAGGMSDGIRVFDVESRQPLGDAIPVDADSFGWTFALRPDGRALVVPGGTKGIVVWNLDERRPRRPQPHQTGVGRLPRRLRAVQHHVPRPASRRTLRLVELDTRRNWRIRRGAVGTWNAGL